MVSSCFKSIDETTWQRHIPTLRLFGMSLIGCTRSCVHDYLDHVVTRGRIWSAFFKKKYTINNFSVTTRSCKHIPSTIFQGQLEAVSMITWTTWSHVVTFWSAFFKKNIQSTIFQWQFSASLTFLEQCRSLTSLCWLLQSLRHMELGCPTGEQCPVIRWST